MNPNLRARRFSALASLLFLWSIVPGSLLTTRAQAPQAAPAWYGVAFMDSPMYAIGVDGSGNGWVAGTDPKDGESTLLYRLQNDALTPSQFVFPKVLINRIALSKDGNEGWAVGSDSGAGRGALIHYSGGNWSKLNDIITGAGQNFVGLDLDPSGLNGWATGITSDGAIPEMLRLTNGKWDSVYDTIPEGILFNRVAADTQMKYVWASGFDSNTGDAALYHWQNGRWVSVSKPVGHYVIFDLAVDSTGNGWAGLDTNDEPANSPVPTGFLRLHADGSYTLVESPVFVSAQTIMFSALRLDDTGNGWALGNILGVGSGPNPVVIFRLQGDSITGQQYPVPGSLAGAANQQPVNGQVTDLAVVSPERAWAVSFSGPLMRYGTLPPNGAVPAPAVPLAGAERCFDETGKCMHGAFLDFWQKKGGLTQFGLPVSNEITERLGDGKVYLVQYTERARFEYHPENKDPNYKVLLGLLGTMIVQGREAEVPFQKAQPVAGATYFKETGHNMSGPVGDYWKRSGGLPVFGFPISEAFNEVSPTDGKTYLVQYFERNRLEYHPENKDPKFQVLLGLLGVQQYQVLYGTKP